MSAHECLWYEDRNCSHAHCPEGCSKPQPFLGDDGVLRCSRCLVLDGVESEMVPCTPEVCEGEQ